MDRICDWLWNLTPTEASIFVLVLIFVAIVLCGYTCIMAGEMADERAQELLRKWLEEREATR